MLLGHDELIEALGSCMIQTPPHLVWHTQTQEIKLIWWSQASLY